MKIFIPYTKHKPIKKEVLSSTIGDVVLVDCTYDKTVPKLQRVILSENKMKETALKEVWDLCVYQQADIVNLMTDNFETLEKFLKDNPDFGAIAASRYWVTSSRPLLIYNNEYKNHICSGCIAFNRKGLESVKFDLSDKSTCISISESLFAAGLKYGYVDGELRIKHLRVQ